MNEITIYGAIDKIGVENVINERFKIVKVIIDDLDPNKPQLIEVTFSNGRIDNLNGLSAGDKVEVKAKLQGRRVVKDGVENVFNTISGFKIIKS